MFQFHYYFFIYFILIFSCNNNINEDSHNFFRYNESSSITSLDPVFTNNQANIWAVNQIFNTLVELDNNLIIRPSLAKEWKISSDGLKYTFLLRDDVYYHHSPCFGKDSTRLISSKDFLFSISRLSDENILSPGSWVLDYLDIDKIKILNDSIIEINLPKPFPGLLGLLSMNYFSFIPKEAINYFGSKFSSNPIGTGPFSFKYWKKNEKLILLKNKNYFEYEENARLPYLDGISISFLTQKESVFMNFILGKFDFVSGLDNSFRDEFIDEKGKILSKYDEQFSIISNQYMNTEYLGFNLSKLSNKSSPLLSKYFRKALNYSFDRDVISKYLRNGLVLPGKKGFVPPVLSNCYEVNGYSYYPDSVNYYLNKISIEELDITLNTTSDYLDICEYIQYSAQKFGIKINIQVSSPSVHRELVSSSQAHLFRASWIGDYPDPENFLSLFYSKNKSPNGPNYTHFSHEIFDSLYESSFYENDLKRCSTFAKMEQIILDESMIIPLYYDYAVRLVSKDISNMSINSMNSLSLKKVKKNNR
ncbi:MAG: ABC transporter substrate-binding protein [Flavobacteriales bacterium]|nr:ABC transporter substrate-binding protein [Flavobacteriales bacterium]|tara:strand:- start:45876 stop:47474 length:1599 start_codon:yes stop_codon:yes gene_type:complete